MKESILHLFRNLAAIALPTFLFTGCVEQSIVIKVNKDGSGIVHERNYQNDAMGQMFTIGGGDEAAGGPPVEESESATPTEEELKEVATRMGEGVSFKLLREGKNKSGWPGYEVIYEFTDVNQLKVDMNQFSSDSGEEMSEAVEPGGEDPDETITFELSGDVLKVMTPDPVSSLGDQGNAPGSGGADDPVGAADPFANLDPADPQSAMAMQMMAGMTTGMRMGLFVMPGDPIVDTNAKHRNGDMLTVFMMDMGKVFQNPANLAKMQNMKNEKDREALQKVADEIDGMTVDLQSPITIQFQ